MQSRRSFAHGPDGGWSSIALHLASAEGGKEGFYLTLFPDARPQATVFLSPKQLEHLLDLAQDSVHSDQSIWDFVAKIPLEPLLPSRALGTRLRWLLLDSANPIREQVRLQLERRPPPSAPIESEEVRDSSDNGDASLEPPPPAKPPWQVS